MTRVTRKKVSQRTLQETTTPYTTATETLPNYRPERPLTSLTLGDLTALLKALIREAVRAELPFYLDADGYLVFRNEQDYAAYLEKQSGRLPSQIKAYYIDDAGWKVYYSDEEFSPEYKKRVDTLCESPTVPADEVWAELHQLGVKV